MFRNLRKKTKKNLNWIKRLKIKKNLVAPVSFLPLISISPNLHIILKKKITYPSRSQRGTPVLKIEKMAVNPRNGTLTETQKTPSIF